MSPTKKAWYKSKTILMGAAVALMGALQEFSGVLEQTEGDPQWVAMVVGVLMIGLRMVTKTPVGVKDDSDS